MMKYIITENRLNDLIKKYLDKINWDVWDFSDSTISVYDKDKNEKVFHTRFYQTFPDVEENEFTLHIKNDFFDRLTSMFSNVNPWFIVEWFNEKFDTNCVTFDIKYNNSFNDDDDE